MDVASGDESTTTERVLTLLGPLQQRQLWTGPELADRLGVTPRTVRRDVERLRTPGYPVHASQGVGGGYQLGPGQDLPPLLLDAVAFPAGTNRTGTTWPMSWPAGSRPPDATSTSTRSHRSSRVPRGSETFCGVDRADDGTPCP